jgi:hypothetical protein
MDPRSRIWCHALEEIKSSHLVILSHATEVARLIKGAAQS